MLMEHETSKLKDLDEEYATELREWKAQLKPRKQVTNKALKDFMEYGYVESLRRPSLYDVCPSLSRLDLYLAPFLLPYSRAPRQYFEEVLASEQAAQDSYYEDCDSANSIAAGNLESNCIPEGKEQPEWYDILRSPSTTVRQSRSGLVPLSCDEPI